MNRYYNPVRTVQGPGALGQLPELVEELSPKGHILLLLYCRDLLEHPALQRLCSQWGSRAAVRCFGQSNPNVEQLYQMYQETRELEIGLVIAIGGGSTLDVGKSLCCLYASPVDSVEQLREKIATKDYNRPACPWIGVPTTAGTGSEVTSWATIWDPQLGRKYSIDTPANYAYAALADPLLLGSMPLALAVSSALDAAAHAAESYWAKASNMASKALALEAIRLVMGHMEELLADPRSPGACDAMSQGSLLAGLAFSNTRTTACHSISYPLTMDYGIPHGAAVSLLLAPVAALNCGAAADARPLFTAFGVSGARELGEKITGILSRAGYPVSLGQWGIERQALPQLAERGITKGRADNNPVELTPQIVLEILTGLL